MDACTGKCVRARSISNFAESVRMVLHGLQVTDSVAVRADVSRLDLRQGAWVPEERLNTILISGKLSFCMVV